MEKESYVNAYDVLPEHLVNEIQKHYTGRLWVPVKSSFYEERNRLIRELRAKGEPTYKIARIVGLTKRRVRQIAINEGGNKST